MLSLPCAKINIGLNVTGKRPDGYHNLETVFYPIPLTDVLEIKELHENEKEDIQIIGMPKGEDPLHNLVYLVYSDLRREYNLPRLSIYLYKKIPIGAGLGGGSSDAAEMMKAMNEMFCAYHAMEPIARFSYERSLFLPKALAMFSPTYP